MNILKKLRFERGVTQFTLSRAIGISEPMISKIETGRKLCSDDLVAKIADYFQVPEASIREDIGEIEYKEEEVTITYENPTWQSGTAKIVSTVSGVPRHLFIYGKSCEWFAIDLRSGEGWDGAKVFLDMTGEWKGVIRYQGGDSSRFEVKR